MSARKPSVSVVRSDAGWFGRITGSNGVRVWQTEVYARRRGAVRAVTIAVEAVGHSCHIATDGAVSLTVRNVDERVTP